MNPVSQKETFSTNRLIPVVAVLLTVVIFLGTAEFGLWIYEIFNADTQPKAKGIIHRASDKPGLIYELTPDAQMERQGVLIKINAQGFRDDDFPAEDVHKGPRVLVSGDSVAWGWGVSMEDAYPQLLEQALVQLASENGRFPPVVFNTAVDGYSTEQELASLRHNGSEIQPDLIILGYVLNDPSDSADGGLARHYRNELRLQRLLRVGIERLREVLRSEDIPQQYHRRLHALHAGKIADQFEQLAQLSQDMGADVVVVVMPVFRFEPGEPYEWEEIHRDLERLSGKNGFHHIDLFDAFSDFRSSEVAIDFLHPNKQGHELVAEQLISPVAALIWE